MGKVFVVLVLALFLGGCKLSNTNYFAELRKQPNEVRENLEKLGYVVGTTTISKNGVVLFVEDCTLYSSRGNGPYCGDIFQLPDELKDSIIDAMDHDIALARQQYIDELKEKINQ